MNKEDLQSYFRKTSPTAAQKGKMRSHVLSNQQAHPGPRAGKWVVSRWLAVPVACLVLAVAALLLGPIGGEGMAYGVVVRAEEGNMSLRLADSQQDHGNLGTSVSKVDARPGLEFYIEGEDIAKIEITTENEYIYAHDWTETQHEKYWNLEYYQHFDEERQISVADFSRLYDKALTMVFGEGFEDYDQIWYRWTAWNLYQWAAEDNYSRFLGAGMPLEPASEEEKMELAAGAQSGIGHIQLEGYPKQLLEDRITIAITDRQGKVTTKVIKVAVTNNELRQTVVTANLVQ